MPDLSPEKPKRKPRVRPDSPVSPGGYIFGVQNCGAYLGVSAKTVYRWINAHQIPFIPRGSHRFLFRKASLDEYFAKHEVPPYGQGAYTKAERRRLMGL